VSGHIVRIDTVEHLIQPIQEKVVVQITCANTLDAIQGKLFQAFPELDCKTIGQRLLRVEADGPVRVGPLIRFLEDHGVEVFEARRMRPSLEDVFVRITGIEADAMHKERESAGPGQ
jgi:ABC-2 type transport system ATP-binding protein